MIICLLLYHVVPVRVFRFTCPMVSPQATGFVLRGSALSPAPGACGRVVDSRTSNGSKNGLNHVGVVKISNIDPKGHDCLQHVHLMVLSWMCVELKDPCFLAPQVRRVILDERHMQGCDETTCLS